MILLALLSGIGIFGDPQLDAALRAAPAPVRSFIERRSLCDHWAGEEPYDAARGRQISRGLRTGRCDRIDRDGARLRRLHADDAAVVRLLDAKPAE
ncbi:hypothetical protein [uncultured Sphingomonas sp.]|uniref:hypothetical protein n=1 Tax=uncultured Sphingomonas sp. TaxID=158754 RepID=UPI0025DC2593|nr:hypothetical protein [uncultured Sphingomonas sp.]